MATSPQKNRLSKLETENRRLKAENKRLTEIVQTAKSGRFTKNLIRRLGIIFFTALAVVVLVAGNMIFWAGNTIVKTDRYVETVSPLIENPEIQNALALYTTEQLFKNFNVEQFTEEVLPPRAAFLAPTLNTQIRQYTEKTLKTILQNPKFQDVWNQSQERAHARLIEAAKEHGSDGVLDINEIYKQLSTELKSTKLAFLADRPLPSRVGSVAVIESDQLAVLNKVINNIDLWRVLAVLLLLVCSTIVIWLSRNRRRAIITLSAFFAVALFISLISLRISREVLASSVNPQYAEAVRQAVQTITQPLVVQTSTLIVASLLVLVIAWVSGPYRSAQAVKRRTQDLLEGRLHSALFGGSENSLTLWIGAHKRTLQWLVVAIVALGGLFVRLTPTVLLVCAITILVLVLAIETLAAPVKASNPKA